MTGFLLRCFCVALAFVAFGFSAPFIHAAEAPAKPSPPKFSTEANDGFVIEREGLTVKGIFLKPSGKGPFPAILISHGLGGNARGFGLPKAKDFVKLGYVCIAP